MAVKKTPLVEVPFEELREHIASDIELFQQILTRARQRVDPLSEVSIDLAASLYEEIQQILAVKDLGEDGWKLVKLTQQARAMLQRAFPKR